MERVLDRAPCIAMIFDGAWQLQYCNQRGNEVLGHDAPTLKRLAVTDILVERAVDEPIPRAGAPDGQGPLARFEPGLIKTARGIVEVSAMEVVPCNDKNDGDAVLLLAREADDLHCSEERTRISQQEAVARMGLMALSRVPFDVLMNRTVAILADTLGVEYAKILELDHDANVFLLRYGVGWKEGRVGHAIVGTERTSQAGYTLLSSHPVIVQDLPNETRFHGPELLLEHGVTSGMSVIIHSHDRTYGVLGAHSREKRRFTQDDANFLQAVANVIGESIDHQKALQSLRESEERYKQLNEELEKRVHERTLQLQLANKELESFSFTVSHDLRAPLRRIEGFTTAILEDYSNKLDDPVKDYLDRIVKSANHMGALIEELLSLARLSKQEVFRTRVNISAIVRSIAAALERSEPGRKVEFSIQDGVYAHADPRLIRVVLDNLLLNAWKFSRKRDVTVIRFGRAISDHGEAFFVQDNGAGFDPKYQEKLFAIFQRLHPQEEYEGTGIGLATVQRIVQRHHGMAWADGAPGEGATFYFTIGATEEP